MKMMTIQFLNILIFHGGILFAVYICRPWINNVNVNELARTREVSRKDIENEC